MKEKIILNIPIQTEKGFTYYPLTYKALLKIGEDKYIFLLNFLKQGIHPLPNKGKLQSCLILLTKIESDKNYSLLYVFMQLLKEILKIEKIEIKNDKAIWCDEILINNTNFLELLKVIIFEFDLIYERDDDDKHNPKDKKAEQIIKKLNKSKDKINKIKNNEEKDTVSNIEVLIKTCFDLKISSETFLNSSAAYCKKMMETSHKQTVLNAALNGADMEKIKMKDLF